MLTNRLIGMRAQRPLVTFELAANGAYTWPPDPRNIHYNGKTYLSWGDTDGIKIAAYDHATQTLSTPFLLHSLSQDIHNAGAICIRDSDKRIIVFYAGHNQSECWIRISTNPEDVTAFGSEVPLDSQLGGGPYTYPAIFQLTAESPQNIYLIYRNSAGGTGGLAYGVSDDDGATWAGGQLMTPDTGQSAYWRVSSNGIDRIDIVTTENDRTDGDPSSLYHVYWEAGWRTSDGTPIVTGQPFDASEFTLIYGTSEGPCSPMGVSYDGSGNPVALFQVDYPWPMKLRYARWDGAAWQISTIGLDEDGHGLGFAGLDHRLAGSVWASREVAGINELFRYDTTDEGATWGPRIQLTSGSVLDNDLPDVVWDGIAGLRLVYILGEYTNITTYDYSLRGMA